MIPPGIDLSRWPMLERRRVPGEPVRLLFVGGDFARKGGDLLLEVFEQQFAGMCELHLVTRSEIRPRPGVRIYNDLSPNYRAFAHSTRLPISSCFPQSPIVFHWHRLKPWQAGCRLFPPPLAAYRRSSPTESWVCDQSARWSRPGAVPEHAHPIRGPACADGGGRPAHRRVPFRRCQNHGAAPGSSHRTRLPGRHRRFGPFVRWGEQRVMAAARRPFPFAARLAPSASLA